MDRPSLCRERWFRGGGVTVLPTGFLEALGFVVLAYPRSACGISFPGTESTCMGSHQGSEYIPHGRFPKHGDPNTVPKIFWF